MKPSPRLLLCAGLAAALLAAGCDSAPSRSPKTNRTFVLSADQPTPDVEMGLVSAIRVVLPGPAAGSGLSWEIVANNNKVLEQMGGLKASATAAPGPATEVSFYSLKPGKSDLLFVLINPAAMEAVPVATCKLTVRVVD